MSCATAFAGSDAVPAPLRSACIPLVVEPTHTEFERRLSFLIHRNRYADDLGSPHSLQETRGASEEDDCAAVVRGAHCRPSLRTSLIKADAHGAVIVAVTEDLPPLDLKQYITSVARMIPD